MHISGTAPPSYSRSVGAAHDDTIAQSRTDGDYATVGSGVGGSRQGRGTSPGEVGATAADVPIYSNSTITELANDVQLQGAEGANQTDV